MRQTKIINIGAAVVVTRHPCECRPTRLSIWEIDNVVICADQYEPMVEIIEVAEVSNHRCSGYSNNRCNPTTIGSQGAWDD